MHPQLHIFGGSSKPEQIPRGAKLVGLASSDAHKHIGKILIQLRRIGIENELSEDEIRQIEQGITSQIVEQKSYEQHRREALALLEIIRTKRRAISTLGLSD